MEAAHSVLSLAALSPRLPSSLFSRAASLAGRKPSKGIRTFRRLRPPTSNRILPPRLRLKPSRRLLHDGSESEQRFLIEWTAYQLQAQRKPLAVEACGHRNARQPGHVYRHGKDVVQIHLDGIGPALLSQTERGRRRRGCEHCVHASVEAVLEILLDQGSYFLRAQV